jgi:hypothetical protein
VAVELARFFWIGGDRDAAYTYIDRALHLTENRPRSRARAYALVERAAYHMNASEEVQASNLLREALPLTEALAMDELRVRALDVLAWARMYSGDVDGVDDSKRAIELARESHALYRLIVAELNLQGNQFFVGQPAKASEALRQAQRDVESYGTVDQRQWLRVAQAHDAMVYGRWDEASDLVAEMFADRRALDTGYIGDPVGLAIRATIELARGHVNAASASSETALERARRAKDPQILAPAILVRSTVMVAQGRRDPASRLAMELLDQGSVSVPSLLLLHPAATPIELAWLARDLGLEAELIPVLRAAPDNPWLKAASSIVNGDLATGVELVAHIGAPSFEAYTRLRAAQAMVAAGQHTDARPQLETALVFYQSVRATHYIDQAKAAIAASHKPSARTLQGVRPQ